MDAVANNDMRAQVAPQPQAGALDEHALQKALTAYDNIDAPHIEALMAAIAAYLAASPQPANPAQVTELAADKIQTWHPLKKALWDVVTFEQLNDGHYINAYDLTDKLHFAVTAAIGAGGQAAAWLGEGDGFKSFTRSETTANKWRKGGIKVTAVSALSQPHPADERVVEALRAAEALLNNLWIGVVSGTRSHEENWKEFEHRYPGVKGLHDTVAAAKEGR